MTAVEFMTYFFNLPQSSLTYFSPTSYAVVESKSSEFPCLLSNFGMMADVYFTSTDAINPKYIITL